MKAKSSYILFQILWTKSSP